MGARLCRGDRAARRRFCAHKRAWRGCGGVAAWVATRQLALDHDRAAARGRRSCAARSCVGRAVGRSAPSIYRASTSSGTRSRLPRRASSCGACWRAVERTFVSHRSAAASLGIAREPAARRPRDRGGRGCRSAKHGIRVHRGPSDLADRGSPHQRGLPVTSPARTRDRLRRDRTATARARASDLRGAGARRLIRRATRLEAALERAGTGAGVAQAAGDSSARRGRRRAHPLGRGAADAAARAGDARLPAAADQRASSGVRERRLPLARASGVIVEVDGYEFHGHRVGVRARPPQGRRADATPATG